ncbi:MAG: VOC family protein [Pseudomonadota bacterium]
MKVRPHIMLHGGVAEAAIALWRRAFPDLEATPPAPPALLWTLSLGGQVVTLFDSPTPHDFAPTPSWSFMVDLEAAQDVDAAHAVLSEGGHTIMPLDGYDFADRFAWVEDAFGISWQLRYGARA